MHKSLGSLNPEAQQTITANETKTFTCKNDFSVERAPVLPIMVSGTILSHTCVVLSAAIEVGKEAHKEQPCRETLQSFLFLQELHTRAHRDRFQVSKFQAYEEILN
jgi:hypothetical protein